MKKLLIIIGIVTTILIIGFVVFMFYNKENNNRFVVTFNSNGGSKVKSIVVECGKELSLPKNPTRSGYSFVSWVDKNGTPIYDKALLSCDDITLKANWKKKSSTNKSSKNNSTKNNTNNNTTTQPSTNKTYKCPAGYTLNSNNKCETSTTAKDSCPSDYSYSTKQKVCYNSQMTSFSRKCKTVTASNGNKMTGELVIDRRANKYICGYGELTTYKGNERSCEHAGGTYCVINTKCYSRYIENNYEITCPSGYTYYSEKALSDSQTSAGCYRTSSPARPCDSGYTLEGNVCKKYVDPTLE